MNGEHCLTSTALIVRSRMIHVESGGRGEATRWKASPTPLNS